MLIPWRVDRVSVITRGGGRGGGTPIPLLLLLLLVVLVLLSELSIPLLHSSSPPTCSRAEEIHPPPTHTHTPPETRTSQHRTPKPRSVISSLVVKLHTFNPVEPSRVLNSMTRCLLSPPSAPAGTSSSIRTHLSPHENLPTSPYLSSITPIYQVHLTR